MEKTIKTYEIVVTHKSNSQRFIYDTYEEAKKHYDMFMKIEKVEPSGATIKCFEIVSTEREIEF